MKKLIAFALTGVMVLGLTACGGKAGTLEIEYDPDEVFALDGDSEINYNEDINGEDENYNGVEDIYYNDEDADIADAEVQGGYAEGEYDEGEYDEEGPSFPMEEYGTNPDDLDYFIGKWEGNMTPPVIWYIFTADGHFYCNRDKGYLEKGTYVVHPAGDAWLTYDSGENEDLFNFDTDYISYADTDGLSRTTKDDTVDQWILDEF